MGISREGQGAQDLFCELTRACEADSRAEGDAKFEGRHVEVKKATSTKLDQVRAVKYIPLVVFEEPSQAWYVVPAHVVVELAAKKGRGQHTENPFESATLSTKDIAAYRVPAQADREAFRDDLKRAT